MKQFYCHEYGAFIEHRPKVIPLEGNVVSLRERMSSQTLEKRLFEEYHDGGQPMHISSMKEIRVQENGDIFGYQDGKVYLLRDQEVVTPWFETIEKQESGHYIGIREKHEFLIKPFKAYDEA